MIEISSQVGIHSVARFRITNRFRRHFIKDGNKYWLSASFEKNFYETFSSLD